MGLIPASSDPAFGTYPLRVIDTLIPPATLQTRDNDNKPEFYGLTSLLANPHDPPVRV